MEFAVRHHASWTGQTIANLRVRDRDANTSACPVDLLSFGLSSVSQFARMWSPDSVAWIGSTSVRLFPPPPPPPVAGQPQATALLITRTFITRILCRSNITHWPLDPWIRAGIRVCVHARVWKRTLRMWGSYLEGKQPYTQLEIFHKYTPAVDVR